MREIKFRAANSEFGQYHSEGEGIIPYPDVESINDSIRENQKHGWIMLQFTGLKDKNGKEIFEGDILLFGDNIKDGETAVVEWWKGEAMFETNPILNGLSKSDISYEVIGNIYQNPEIPKNNQSAPLPKP